MILTYDNFIDNLFARFPEFKHTFDKETLEMIADNPTVAFNFFVHHFYNRRGHEQFEENLVALLDEMNDAKGLQFVLDDFLLSIYSLTREKGIDINPFVNKLTPRTKGNYDLNVEFWERENGIKN